ncbi:MAG: hypothetical protein RBR31_07835 [Bacteroidales bacterium]|nr:hypothetical protein [Bacteroidales bacterium]
MNKTLAAVLILAALPLVGCAGPKITEQDASMANAAALSRNYCVDARSRGEAARMAAIAQMDPSQQGVAIMAEAMRAQAEALAGKGDPCGSGMNAYEARARIAAGQNEAATGLVGSLVRGTLIGVGIVEGADVIKTAIKGAGDRTNIQGDGNSYAQERVTSNADTTTKNFGENGTATSGSPTTTGPDKSTNTTIEAPEPVAEEPEGEFVPTEPPDFPDGPVEISGPGAAE